MTVHWGHLAPLGSTHIFPLLPDTEHLKEPKLQNKGRWASTGLEGFELANRKNSLKWVERN